MNLQWGTTVFLKMGTIDSVKAKSPTEGYDFENESHV